MNTLGVVTISFNQARFLQQAVDSVQCASPSRLAYVAVDPGSTDGSREILALHQNRFSKLIFEPDAGPADGLNKGFSKVGGSILGYLNSDDRFLPGALDYVLDYFDAHPQTDVLLGGIRLIDEHDRVEFRKRTPDHFHLSRFLHKSCYFWQQATFFRRSLFEAVGGFNPENRASWDGELVLDFHLHGAEFAYTNSLLGDFRLHAQSLTGSRRLHVANAREMERMRRKAKVHGYRPLPGPVETALRLAYKLNPVRHLKYIFHGGLPAL